MLCPRDCLGGSRRCAVGAALLSRVVQSRRKGGGGRAVARGRLWTAVQSPCAQLIPWPVPGRAAPEALCSSGTLARLLGPGAWRLLLAAPTRMSVRAQLQANPARNEEGRGQQAAAVDSPTPSPGGKLESGGGGKCESRGKVFRPVGCCLAKRCKRKRQALHSARPPCLSAPRWLGPRAPPWSSAVARWRARLWPARRGAPPTQHARPAGAGASRRPGHWQMSMTAWMTCERG